MIQLTANSLREIFPKAPQAVLDAFLVKQGVLSGAGINHTRQRLAYFFANIEHECGGFTIPNLTENINYTASRMAQVWPNRFASADAVAAKYGTAPGWQKKAFDDIYGNRMGNRPGTSDGSTYIGRGGPQWTGRDGYEECGKRANIAAVDQPSLVCNYNLQPEVCAAFWSWKKLNANADIGDFKGAVKKWNGGANGMADRLAKLAGNDPILARLGAVEDISATVAGLPGKPPTVNPPQEVMDEATRKERATQKAGVAGAATGGAGKVVEAKTEQPPALLSPVFTYSLIGVGVAIVVVAGVMIAKKKAAVVANWF